MKCQIITNDYYSNCIIEAFRAKLKDWKNVKITYISPFRNVVFCPHFLWSDGKYDYDFGYETRNRSISNWTIHKGHIRQRELGFNQKYKDLCNKRKISIRKDGKNVHK